MTSLLLPPGVGVLDDMDALVPPAFLHVPAYVETLGPEVCDLIELFGRTPNPEQRLLLDGAFGMDRAGRLTAFEVFVLAARQNLKTGFMMFRALGKALILKRPLQLWTAHKESATDQAMVDLREMIASSDELSRRVKDIRDGKGSKEVIFVNGCRIVFRPRTAKAGQSVSADDVDMDEYFAVQAAHQGSLVPTLSTRPKAQLGGASSAPHVDSDEQRAVMQRGRLAALGLVEEPRLMYAEWSPIRRVGTTLDGRPRFGPPSCGASKCTHVLGSVGCIADDREVIKLSNPSVGRSAAPAISWDFVADERRKLASTDAIVEYFRERLSVGAEGDAAGAETVFGAGFWEACATRGAPPAVPIALGVAVSVDELWASVAAAGFVGEVEDPDDEDSAPTGRLYVSAVDRRPETGWLIPRLQELQAKYEDIVILIDEKGPTKGLLTELEDADVAIETLTLEEYADACSRVYAKVRRVELLHPSAEDLGPGEVDELNEAVTGADWRNVSDRRVWGRRQSAKGGSDVSMLEAATLAAAGAEKFGW